MSWTSPVTVVTDAIIPANFFNTQVRDNLNATETGIATTAGDIFYGLGTNQLTTLPLASKYDIVRLTNIGPTLEAQNQAASTFAYSIIAQTVSNGIITFDTTDYNSAGMGVLGNSTSLVCNTAGLYIVAGALTQSADNIAGDLFLNRYNSSNVLQDTYARQSVYFSINSTNQGVSVKCLMYLMVGDYIELWWVGNSITTLTTLGRACKNLQAALVCS